MSRTRICFLEGLPTITSIVEGFGGVPSARALRSSHQDFHTTIFLRKGHS